MSLGSRPGPLPGTGLSLRDRLGPVTVAIVTLLAINAGVVAARTLPSRDGGPAVRVLAAVPQGHDLDPVTAPRLLPGTGRAEVAADSAPVEVPVEPPAPPVVQPEVPAEPRISLVRAPEKLAAYAGLSTWVDLWDTGLSPERQAEIAAAGGVQTIFVQSARFNSPGDIHDPDRLGRLIDTAKRYGLKVMVWYIPDFLDPAKDLRRSQAAINFTTPNGNRADSFGLDIEMEKLPDVAERSRRLITLSQQLRAWVGPDYPMSAIVLPPLQLDMRPSWWPNFPWREIAPYYDVWVPMSYSSFRGQDADTTYRWNFLNIVETRARVGDPNLPIHMAGGIADSLPHVDAFARAVQDGLSLGGGLYDLHTTRPDAWPALRTMRAES